MNPWEQRQKVELTRCLDSFEDQFREWQQRTLRAPWETHWSQVQAVCALLSGVREGLRAALSTESADDLEPQVLSAWRVWEAFRCRLALRQEEMFCTGLNVADEIAWACRQPLNGQLQRPEPALIYLSGSTSPSALARHSIFNAEEGVTEALWKAAARLLEDLPVPLIGLPWHEIFHAPGLVAIAHEMGHVIEVDAGLTTSLNAQLTAACTAAKVPEQSPDWQQWRAEIFADHFALRQCGPSFAGMLSDVLAPRALRTAGRTYPPHDVRMELCFEAVNQMGLVAEAAELRTAWRARVPASGDPHLAAASAVVTALGQTPIGATTLDAILPFGSTQQDQVRALADGIQTGIVSKDLVPATMVAAAAWHLFKTAPEFFGTAAATEDVFGVILRAAGPQGRRSSGRPRDLHRGTPIVAATAPPAAFAGYAEKGRGLVKKALDAQRRRKRG